MEKPQIVPGRVRGQGQKPGLCQSRAHKICPPLTTKSYEPLLGVVREQRECPFRQKGVESKSQNSQGSMKIVIVGKKAADSN